MHTYLQQNLGLTDLKSNKHVCHPSKSLQGPLLFCATCGLYMPSSTYNTTIKALRSSHLPSIEPMNCNPNKELLNMTLKQQKNRYYNPNAFHSSFRNQLVEWISGISKKLEFNTPTIHLAVAILDTIMSQYSVQENQVRILTFMSLYMSAKMEDHEDKLPTLESVAELFEYEFSVDDFINCERTIFAILDYNLNLQTPYKFVSFFLFRGILFDADFKFKVDRFEPSSITNHLEHLCQLFLKANLMCYRVNRFTSLAVACCVIALARKYLDVEEIWPKHLELLAKCSFDSLKDCFSILENYALEHFKDELKQYFVFSHDKKELSANFQTREKLDSLEDSFEESLEKCKQRNRLKSEDFFGEKKGPSPIERKISFS